MNALKIWLDFLRPYFGLASRSLEDKAMSTSLARIERYRNAVSEWVSTGRKAAGAPPPVPESYGLKSVAEKFIARKLVEEAK